MLVIANETDRSMEYTEAIMSTQFLNSQKVPSIKHLRDCQDCLSTGGHCSLCLPEEVICSHVEEVICSLVTLPCDKAK